MKTRILSNFYWLIADRMLRLLGGLLIGAWMARYLGPEQFGLLNYTLAFVGLFAAVARLGMDELLVRELNVRPQQTPVLLGTFLYMRLVAALVFFSFSLFVSAVVHSGDEQVQLLVWIVALGMIFNVLEAFDIHYQSHTRSQSIVKARGAAFLLFSIARIVLILTGQPLLFFAILSSLEIGAGGALLAWLHRREFGSMKWRFDIGWVRSLWRDGWPLVLSSALIVLHTRIDQVMLGQMLGPHEVGIYSAAIRLSESWLFVPVVLTQSVMPYLLKLSQDNSAFYQVRLMQLYSLLFWIGGGVGCIVLGIGNEIIALLFGAQFRDAYWSLVFLIWTGIFISHSLIRGIWLVQKNLQYYRLVTNLVAVPLNISLNYLLIPTHGAAGAALASLLSIGGSTWLLPLLFEKIRPSALQMLKAIHPRYLRVHTT